LTDPGPDFFLFSSSFSLYFILIFEQEDSLDECLHPKKGIRAVVPA